MKILIGKLPFLPMKSDLAEMGPISGDIKNYYLSFRFTFARRGKILNRERRQCGGGGLMVWGMIMPKGLLAIKQLESISNQKII